MGYFDLPPAKVGMTQEGRAFQGRAGVSGWVGRQIGPFSSDILSSEQLLLLSPLCHSCKREISLGSICEKSWDPYRASSPNFSLGGAWISLPLSVSRPTRGRAKEKQEAWSPVTQHPASPNFHRQR